MPAEVIPAVVNDGTYLKPPHGWTCFYCGDTFTTPGAARAHFGNEPSALAGCQIKAGDELGLLMELRRAEAALARYQAEDSETERAMRAMRADHARAVIDAEEKGYNRGLRDCRANCCSQRENAA